MILNTLRERAGYLLIGFIGLAIVGFLFSDAVSSGAPFWAEARNQVGKIGGEKISYEEFSTQVEQARQQMMASTGQSSVNPQITSYAVQQVWRTLLEKSIYSRELDALGIATGPEELALALTGDNPHPIARQAFANPQTGQYSSEMALDIYRNRAMMPLQQQQQLLDLEQRVRLANSVEKYIDLVSAGVYVTTLEMERIHEQNEKTATVSFVKLDYNSVADTAVSISGKDLENYYKENRYRYKQDQEQRSFDYVLFDVVPSAEDTASAQEEINRLAEQFRDTANDSLFYMSNSTSRAPLVYQKENELSPELAENLFNAEPGTVHGPYFENGAYKVAKLLDAATRPDSVRASHILLSAVTYPNPAERRQMADSLLQRVRSGQSSFGFLAGEISADSLSGAQGGDLGFFGPGNMVPEFEKAAFEGKVGEIKIVETQFGTHLLQINQQRNASRAVKIAVIDKPLEPSQATTRAVYAQANAFAGSIGADLPFEEAAQQAGLVTRVAENVGPIDFFVPGLAEPREVIRWAFDAKLGEVSPLFDLNERYIVARLTEIRPEGYAPLELVRTEVEQEVRRLKKAEVLSGRFREAAQGASNLDAVAQKLGDSTRTAQNVIFSNPMMSGAGYEPALVGAVFGSEAGKVGGPVTGMTGVFGYAVQQFTEPSPITDPEATRETMSEQFRQQYLSFLFEALQDKTKIIDNRANFY